MEFNKKFRNAEIFSDAEIATIEELINQELPSDYKKYLVQVGGIELEESDKHDYYLSMDGKKGLVPFVEFYNFESLNLEIENFEEEEDLIELAPFTTYIPIGNCHGQYRILMGNNRLNKNNIYLFNVEELNITFLTNDLFSLINNHILLIKDLEGFVE